MAYTQQILDVTIWLAIALIFNYFIIYRKNRFIGNLFFAGIGFLVLYVAPADLLYSGVGLLMIFGAVISLVYDIIGAFGHKGKYIK